MTVRVKICGITRIEDGCAAADAGADAVGFVFYPPSPRAVAPARAAAIVAALPPFVTSVGLFVNASREAVLATLATVPLDLLQFHGDEAPDDCAQFARPFLKAVRVRPQTDLIKYAGAYAAAGGKPGLARGLLLDAYVEGLHGGTGCHFDWSIIPRGVALPLVLSGGLAPGNVAQAVRQVRPAAVDVSSGVESAPGVKDHAKIRAFIEAARNP